MFDDLMFSTILDNEHFLALNKASGVHMHSQSGPGLIETLREIRGEAELYPVHRLDTPTSGVLLVAKGQTVNRALSALFAAREIQKYYLALLDKKPSRKQGKIAGDMLKARNGCWKLARTKDNPAVTHFFSYGSETGNRLAVLKPLTGKTHQLRVALKSLGSPIIGDKKYGGSPADRTYLHAWKLRFCFAGKEYDLSADVFSGDFFTNKEFQSRLSALPHPHNLVWPAS